MSGNVSERDNAGGVYVEPPVTDREKMLYLDAELRRATRDYDKLVERVAVALESAERMLGQLSLKKGRLRQEQL